MIKGASVGALVLTMLAPVSVAADDRAWTRVMTVTKGVHCHELGERLELPDAVVSGPGGSKDEGREVVWRITDGDGSVTDVGPVLTDSRGVAVAPDSGIDVRSEVRIRVFAVETDDRQTGATVFYKGVVGDDVTLRPIQVHAGAYSSRSIVDAYGFKSTIRHENGRCEPGVQPGTQLVVSAEHVASGVVHELGRASVSPSGQARLYSYPPSVGEFVVSARALTRAGFSSPAVTSRMTITKDEPDLDGGVVNARIFSDKGIIVSRVPRGARHIVRISLNQEDWRPPVDGEPVRMVEVRFRHLATGEVTRLPDESLVRRGNRRVGDIERTMRSSGTYELTFRGSATDEPSTARFGVRLAPRISLPALTTKAKPYRAVRRTVTIRDGEGFRAQLQHRTRDGWIGSGRSRVIPESGRVRLGTRNDTRKDRRYRVVVFKFGQYGGRDIIAKTEPTWTVRNR